MIASNYLIGFVESDQYLNCEYIDYDGLEPKDDDTKMSDWTAEPEQEWGLEREYESDREGIPRIVRDRRKRRNKKKKMVNRARSRAMIAVLDGVVGVLEAIKMERENEDKERRALRSEKYQGMSHHL